MISLSEISSGFLFHQNSELWISLHLTRKNHQNFHLTILLHYPHDFWFDFFHELSPSKSFNSSTLNCLMKPLNALANSRISSWWVLSFFTNSLNSVPLATSSEVDLLNLSISSISLISILLSSLASTRGLRARDIFWWR